MIAETVRYQNFRNITEAELRFSPGVNVLIGSNAEGKTNALEGIYLLAAGKSFRTSKERDMVAFGADSFSVTVELRDARREQQLSFRAYAQAGKRRECQKNGVPIPRLSELLGTFRAVLFCPEHLALVKAGPAERRTFLDMAICQLRPLYVKSLQRFQKILLQRNALLKQFAEQAGERGVLEVLSDQLARESAFLWRMRTEYVLRLDRFVKRFFLELSERELPELRFCHSLKTEERMTEMEAYERYRILLTSHIEREIAAGATLYGSHKDDIEILLNGREARQFASQGQQRSLALAMKLGEGEISQEYSGEYPVFLFDDVLSELDLQRQRFLLSQLSARQVIMTTCTPPPFESGAAFIEVKNGVYTPR